MKKAFTMIELVLCIVILSVVFTGLFNYYNHIYKNYDELKLFERLYTLETKLYQSPNYKNINLQSSSLNPLNLKEKFVNDGLFSFHKLSFEDENLSLYFKE